MTRSEFLGKLKEALENELSGYLVQDNINYYNNYIMDEVKKGRNEEEVVAELGDPWVIAKTVIGSSEAQGNCKGNNTYEPKQRKDPRQEQESTGNLKLFGLNSWWKKLLLVLGIIGVFAIIIAVIGGIFSLVMPLLVPILVIVCVFRLIGRTRR